jgi:hypothetical protein
MRQTLPAPISLNDRFSILIISSHNLAHFNIKVSFNAIYKLLGNAIKQDFSR